MQSLTRRGALGLGAVSASALVTAAAQGMNENPDDEESVRFKIKDVVLDGSSRTSGPSISASARRPGRSS